MEAEFSELSNVVDLLPSSINEPFVDTELRSLRAEVAASAEMMLRVHALAKLSDAIRHCDAVFSDLLEHIDSFPASPTDLSSSHISQANLSPDEQLSARLSFAKSVIDNMVSLFMSVAEDPRAIAERDRILQTWSELEDMGNDRIHGKKSRPASVISSEKNSSGRNSTITNVSAVQSKKKGYSNLSLRPSNRFLTPSSTNTSSRRVTSASADRPGRSSSRQSSISTNRSVSGPMGSSSSSLYRPTYASRQRTTSLSSVSSSIQTPSRRPSVTSSALRAHTRQVNRSDSPTFSDAFSYPRSAITPSRSSSVSTSTWARAPRPSFPTLPRISTPPTSSSKKRSYVADPKSKLDMAVGEVVNKLPVNINVEVVAETWKDQSGKYWIGDQDPKLCFCRILRSQTVMVRVGGGWTELSKYDLLAISATLALTFACRFIKDHFADAFRILPESPPRHGAGEEKWINSMTLLEAAETNEAPPQPPRTPEPVMPFVPSLSLLTPNGQSPRSLRSTPSTGSPLMPMQFMRRADAENSYLRPATPSKSNTHRLGKSAPTTPSRHLVWRP
jgi:Growth-Arrest-Specific Protein 2 Domain